MTHTMIQRLVLIWLGGLVMLPGMLAQANSTIIVKVTVLTSPCVINGGRPIEVDFGNEVVTTRIDGNNYRRPVSYTLDCSNKGSNNVKLQVQGTGAGFDGQLLQTSKEGLGIAILNNRQRLPLNQWLNFNISNTPVLEAVPVKSPRARLKAGEFTASATMRVDYQ